MAAFSVVVVTAAPPGQAAEAGGAFAKVDGREALLRSIELFLNRDNVKQIQLIVQPDELEDAKRRYASHLGLMGVKLGSGGPRWFDQIAVAAQKLSAEATHVLVHDAARPAVPYTDIDNLTAAVERHSAVALVSPVRSGLIEVDEGGNPLAYYRAAQFMELMTPRAYSKEKFLEIAEGKADLHASQLHLVKGSPLNVRMAGPGDAQLLKTMISMLPRAKKAGPLNPFEEAQW